MLQIKFESLENKKVFEVASRKYSKIWDTEGLRIIQSFKKITGLDFKQQNILAKIYEGTSQSGNLQKPMMLRASYPNDIKIGTLIHELGHRLLFGNGIFSEINGLDSHQQLFLFLYDVWQDLYGKNFADKNVEAESARKGLYDYNKIWNWLIALEDKKKKELLKKLLKITT